MENWIDRVGSEVKFLNVDLEVVSDRDLQPLVEALKDEASNLYCGEYGDGTNLANFETHVEREEETEANEMEEEETGRMQSRSDEGLADALILKFCSLIEGLEGEAKELWATAQRRTFDLGYESGLAPYSLTSTIKVETLQEVVKVGALINLTFYCILDEYKEKEE